MPTRRIEAFLLLGEEADHQQLLIEIVPFIDIKLFVLFVVLNIVSVERNLVLLPECDQLPVEIQQ
jgi:hypothetical protein